MSFKESDEAHAYVANACSCIFDHFPVTSCVCVWTRMYIVGLIPSSISVGRLQFPVCVLHIPVCILSASHLIVQIQVVKLSVCPEVLSVSVQSKVDIATVALNHH